MCRQGQALMLGPPRCLFLPSPLSPHLPPWQHARCCSGSAVLLLICRHAEDARMLLLLIWRWHARMLARMLPCSSSAARAPRLLLALVTWLAAYLAPCSPLLASRHAAAPTSSTSPRSTCICRYGRKSLWQRAWLLTGEAGEGREGRWSKQTRESQARESRRQRRRSAEAATTRARGAAAATKERCSCCNRRAQGGATREGSQDRARATRSLPTRDSRAPTQHSQDGR